MKRTPVELIYNCCFMAAIVGSSFTIKFAMDNSFTYAFVSSTITAIFLALGWMLWYSRTLRKSMAHIITLDEAMIDQMIRYWHEHKSRAEAENNHDEAYTALCYIDAFQSMRLNHGLEILPLERTDERRKINERRKD